jgi:hypothetical protein
MFFLIPAAFMFWFMREADKERHEARYKYDKGQLMYCEKMLSVATTSNDTVAVLTHTRECRTYVDSLKYIASLPRN